MEFIGTDKMEEVKIDLMLQTENILHNILINLADSYPQAPASGGTPRMREVITEVNRVDDEENDLIWVNKISISDYVSSTQKENGNSKLNLPEDEDYT